MATADDIDLLGQACEMCGAEAGVQCREDCPGFYVPDEPDEAQVADEIDAASLMESASAALMGVAHRLPYGQLIDTPPAYNGGDVDLWLAAFAVWLDDYSTMLREKIDALEAGNRKAIALQLEKDVVRRFLGTAGFTLTCAPS